MHKPGIDSGTISSQFNIEIPLKMLSMFFFYILPWLQVRSEFLFESPSIKPKFNNVAVPIQTFDETRDDDLLFSSIIWHCFQSTLSLNFFQINFLVRLSIITLQQKGSSQESYRQSLFLLMFFSQLSAEFSSLLITVIAVRKGSQDILSIETLYFAPTKPRGA